MQTMEIAAPPGSHEITLTRIFNAPRDRVFKALTDPLAIPQWWGPRRYTTTVETMDVRFGGAWRFVQRDAEGNTFAFRGVYHEVTAPERIVYTFEFEGMPGHISLETGTLEDLGGRTKFTATAVFQSVADRDGMLQADMEEGARETWERLAELLEAG